MATDANKTLASARDAVQKTRAARGFYPKGPKGGKERKVRKARRSMETGTDGTAILTMGMTRTR